MPAHLLQRWGVQEVAAHGLPPRRRWAFAALVLVVAVMHSQLLGRLQDWLHQVGPGAVASVALPPRPDGWRVLAPLPAPPALTVATPAVPAATARVSGTAARPGRVPAPTASNDVSNDATTKAAPPASATTTAVPPDATAPGVPTPSPAPSPVPTGVLAAPPVYATRVPPSMDLDFDIERGHQRGQGHWHWSVDPAGYTSVLQASLGDRPWLEQRSQGGLDAAGLAPQRMVERPAARSARAVNFQRDKALVSYSGNTRTDVLWPGIQDKLSWLPQLLAILAARAEWPEGTELQLATASPRGDVALWRWHLVDGRAPRPVPGRVWHWVREAPQPYDYRVDLWVSAQAPHQPLGWQWQRQPGGEPVRWWQVGNAMAP